MTIKPEALNPDFARFCKEPREDREAVFTQVAETTQASAVAIEKDFFVCRVLDALFRLLFNYRPVVFQQGDFRLVPSMGSYVAAATAAGVRTVPHVPPICTGPPPAS